MNTLPVEQALWDPEYPESDGKPMAETDTHIREMMNAILTLRERYEDIEDVYVAGNILLYFEKGVPASCVAPDVFVVKGVHKEERRTYKLWEEENAPEFVIELSSKSTRYEDRGNKREIYYQMGVKEYFLVDPLEEYLKPPLQGFRRGELDFITIVPGKERGLYSQVLGLWLVKKGNALRFLDPETGEILPTPMEKAKLEAARAAREEKRAQQERQRAQQEAEARRKAEEGQKKAEEENARLRAMLEKAGISVGS